MKGGMISKPEALRRARMKLRLTQEELAERAGVSTYTIWRLERQSAGVRGSTLGKLAEVLGVGREDISDTEEPVPTAVA